MPAYTPGQGWQFPIWVAAQSQTTVAAPSAPILPNFAYRLTTCIALWLDDYLHVTSSVDSRSLAIELYRESVTIRSGVFELGLEKYQTRFQNLVQKSIFRHGLAPLPPPRGHRACRAGHLLFYMLSNAHSMTPVETTRPPQRARDDGK